MTRDEVLNMEAGRELDALIAEKVMGVDLSTECDGEMYNEDDSYWSCTKCSKTGEWGPNEFRHTIEPEHYSEYIAAAWKVMEKLVEIEHEPALTIFDGRWICVLDSAGFGREINLPFEDKEFSSTATLAICRAALIAVMELQ